MKINVKWTGKYAMQWSWETPCTQHVLSLNLLALYFRLYSLLIPFSSDFVWLGNSVCSFYILSCPGCSEQSKPPPGHTRLTWAPVSSLIMPWVGTGRNHTLYPGCCLGTASDGPPPHPPLQLAGNNGQGSGHENKVWEMGRSQVMEGSLIPCKCTCILSGS